MAGLALPSSKPIMAWAKKGKPKMQYEIDLRAIKAASFAMSSEETRYYLKGVNIEISAAHGVLAIATDGHRLIAMQAAPCAS